jgi:putative transposase
MVNLNLELTPAIQAYLIALLFRNTRSTCRSLASLFDNISHDSLNRLLHSDFPWSRRLWDFFASKMLHPGGWLVVDDTCWQRYAKSAEAVSKVWSSTSGKVLLGSQVVLLIWTDGKRKVPLACRLWEKGGKSKIELASEMLREAKQRGIEPSYVLFDSWYTAKAILQLLDELEWKYVARIKSNRLFNGKALNQSWHQRFGQGEGKLKGLAHQVKVIKDGKKYLVSNDLQLSPSQMRKEYRRRQQIEETFRLLKQEFGWENCRARKAKALKAHLHLGLMALCLSQPASESQGQTIYAFKQALFRLPIPEQLPFLEHFKNAA